MKTEELQKLINNPKGNFLKKLKEAGINELEYWEKRPENLPREILVRYLENLDDSRDLFPDMATRESDSGKYGETGFKWVFKLEDNFYLMGNIIRVYIKGFFFEENDPRGIEIQSFKKSQPQLKVVK